MEYVIYGFLALTLFVFIVFLACIILFLTLAWKAFQAYQRSRSNEQMVVSGAVMVLKGLGGINRELNGPS